jgi:hypothetical protein
MLRVNVGSPYTIGGAAIDALIRAWNSVHSNAARKLWQAQDK